jgi:ABC-type lipoprotein release transport system permease subunit
MRAARSIHRLILRLGLFRAVVVVASCLPARRAARIDPAVTLKTE